MPIWKESTAPSKEVAMIDTEPSTRSESDYPVDLAPVHGETASSGSVKESIITVAHYDHGEDRRRRSHSNRGQLRR